MDAFKRAFVLLTGLLIPCWALAQAAVIKGKVTDKKGNPLAYASVYIQGTTNGTTTNKNGKYELKLSPGQHTVVFKYMGYKQTKRAIQLDAGQQKTIRIALRERAIETEAVTVTGRDPAYRIIKNAIAEKEAHRKAVRSYECQLYSKANIKADSAAASSLVDSGDLPPGYIYFSESVSTLKYRYPDQYQEVMHSSKVSGREGAVSLNFAFNTPVIFYQDLIELGGTTQRPMISPIADNALNYYKYQLRKTFTEQGRRIHRIAVIPKRPNDPVFRGIIRIVNKTWHIHSLDLTTTTANGLQRFDTFNLEQQYLPVQDSIWRLQNQRYQMKGRIIGLSIQAKALAQFTQYDLTPDWPSNPFVEAIVKVPEKSQDRDSSYWQQIRPFKLTPAEARDYTVKDSIQQLRDQPGYKDSVDSVHNQPGFSDIIFGYDYRKRTKDIRISTPSLIGAFYNFNTVEGWAPELEFEITHTKEEASDWEFRPFVRYGIANETFQGGIRVNKDPWFVGVGRNVNQFQDPQPITPLLNTSYALFNGENFARWYQRAFAEIGYKGNEWGNGWFPAFTVSFQERKPMENNTSFTLAKSDKYESNIPDNPHFQTNANNGLNNFNRHRAFLLKAGLQWKPGLDYMMIKGEKVNLGTEWPTFRVNYRKAVAGIAGSDANFDFFSAGLEGDADLKLLGGFTYSATAGRFLQKARVPFVDYQHFTGQEIIFQYQTMRDFQLLDYYQASTTRPFAEGHFQHNFSGFIWNKIPLARKLKWQVSGTANVLKQENITYWEWGIGLTDLIKLAGARVFSVHFFQSYDGEAFQDRGFRIGLQTSLGIQ